MSVQQPTHSIQQQQGVRIVNAPTSNVRVLSSGQTVRIASSQPGSGHVGSPITTTILRQQPTVLNSIASPIASAGKFQQIVLFPMKTVIALFTFISLSVPFCIACLTNNHSPQFTFKFAFGLDFARQNKLPLFHFEMNQKKKIIENENFFDFDFRILN